MYEEYDNGLTFLDLPNELLWLYAVVIVVVVLAGYALGVTEKDMDKNLEDTKSDYEYVEPIDMYDFFLSMFLFLKEFLTVVILVILTILLVRML